MIQLSIKLQLHLCIFAVVTLAGSLTHMHVMNIDRDIQRDSTEHDCKLFIIASHSVFPYLDDQTQAKFIKC